VPRRPARTLAAPDFERLDALERESREFLRLLAVAVRDGGPDPRGASWTAVRDWLRTLSRDRAERGFSPSETATFVFSLKEPLFSRLSDLAGGDAGLLQADLWRANVLIDALGLVTTEAHGTAREAIIVRQQEELLELSTPVVKLWDGIVALPLIGTLDSNRTQVVMESLLNALVNTGSETAIIDITGVPTVDTLVAQHLLKAVAAARLMGAECIISGIRPQIAQTSVHLGISLPDVVTKATMADAVSPSAAVRRRVLQTSDAQSLTPVGNPILLRWAIGSRRHSPARRRLGGSGCSRRARLRPGRPRGRRPGPR